MQLSVDDLMSLERYHTKREAFRRQVMTHKRPRRIALGPHLTLCFEDRLTIQYQVQEMLRTERIFEREGIQEELDAYNPLIPDGNNWKATMMVEYPDERERRQALRQLVGIEDRVWMAAGDGQLIWAIADEDLDRSTEEKTSAVHFLRFQLSPEDQQAIRSGTPIRAGVDHPVYQANVTLDDLQRAALVADLKTHG